MKKTLFLTITLLLVFNVKAQTKQEPKITYEKFDLTKESATTISMSDLIAVKTPKSDTLFLLNNDLGKSLKDIWEEDKKITKKPVIIYLPLNQLKEKFKYYSSISKK